MRKYLMFLTYVLFGGLGAYAIVLDFGTSPNLAVRITTMIMTASAAAVIIMTWKKTAERDVGGSEAEIWVVGLFSFSVVAVVGAILVAVFTARVAIVLILAATAVVMAAAAVWMRGLGVKFYWVLLAIFSTIGFFIAGLATTNPIYIFGFAILGAICLRWIGDLPKADLEKRREKKQVRTEGGSTK